MESYVVKRLGHKGEGIAEGPVYVPRALPGETVSGVLEGNRLRDVKIQAPSSNRVSPPCRHFGTCGGCQLQHASEEFVAAWKTEFVRSALARHDLYPSTLPMAISPARARRRATFTARRTKKGALAGFHSVRSDTVIPVPDCQLLHPDLMPALPLAERLAEMGASRKGSLKVAVTLSQTGLDVDVSGGKSLDGPLRISLANVAGQYGVARLTWDDETVVTRARPIQEFCGIEVFPPPDSFLQATKEGEAALLDAVLRITQGAKRVVDLFAGCGTFALPLARFAVVHAVDGDARMIEALDHGWKNASGLKRVSCQARDLFRRPLRADELKSYDAAVIDPPRAGAAAQTVELAKARVPTIAYVSCNPVSFARDAKILSAGGYDLVALRVVDQFRWSAHIELVAEFRLSER